MLTRSQVAEIRSNVYSFSSAQKQTFLQWFVKLATSKQGAYIPLANVPDLVFVEAYLHFMHQSNCHEFDAKRAYHAQNLLINRIIFA
jgi:hypothetical protein